MLLMATSNSIGRIKVALTPIMKLIHGGGSILAKNILLQVTAGLVTRTRDFTNVYVQVVP